MPDYHHTVSIIATPFREFTKRLQAGDDYEVSTDDLKKRRIAALRWWIDTNLQGNRSEAARQHNCQPALINDLLADRKSFGEKLARSLETNLRMPKNCLVDPVTAASTVHAIKEEPATYSGYWPFSFTPEDFEGLSGPDKQKVDGAMMATMLQIRSNNAHGQPKKQGGKRRRLQRKTG